MDKKPWEMGLVAKEASTDPAKKPWEMGLVSEPKTYYGKDAIVEVEKREGRTLSLAERRVVEEEGFVSGEYEDDKGISTSGVGQTGKYKDMSFKETFDAHEKDAKRLVDNYGKLPEYLQAELVQAQYRGDLQQSPAFVKLLEEGKYEEAATELLDHKEYKERKAVEDDGVTRRLEALRDAVKKYGKEAGDSADGSASD